MAYSRDNSWTLLLYNTKDRHAAKVPGDHFNQAAEKTHGQGAESAVEMVQKH